jgi:hypothetical protein
MPRRPAASVIGSCRGTPLVALLAMAGAILAVPESGLTTEPAFRNGALAPGEVLDKTNWQKAEGLLPPEIVRHYKNGEYANRLEDWEEEMQWEPAWHEAVRSNRDKLTVNEKGTIVDNATGKQPPYVFGYPFPEIDPEDPDAGIKILWNYFYRVYHNGNRRNTVELTWLSAKGVDRKAGQDVYFLYYDGQPRARAPRNNPENFLVQFLATTMDPVDAHGTTSLSWRYRDAEKRDALWTYVPALRRVRAVSPTNRSDGFLGSDLSQDDGMFFDGKPEEFVWKLVGDKEDLVLADPFRQRRECVNTPLPQGGWQTDFKEVPMVGFQDPTWDGIPWAPVVQVLLRRPVWVIEGKPKDRYYLYGKIQLHIDRETYQGSWNRKFGWKGELLSTVQTNGTGPNVTPDGGKNYFDTGVGGCVVAQIAENMKLDRATVASVNPMKKPISWTAVPLQVNFFDHATLARFGK